MDQKHRNKHRQTFYLQIMHRIFFHWFYFYLTDNHVNMFDFFFLPGIMSNGSNYCLLIIPLMHTRLNDKPLSIYSS